MESGHHLFNLLCEPWKNELRSLLVDSPSEFNQWKCGDSVMFYGIAGQFFDGRQSFEMGKFVPFQGLDFASRIASGWIERDESCNEVCIPVGTMFGISDATVCTLNPLVTKITDSSKLWYISSVDQGFPTNTCHLFCGAFAGWERACQWLAREKGLNIGSSISVDAAHDVMKIWSLQNSSQFWDHDIPCSHSSGGISNGALMSIQNLTWMNLCRYQSNMTFTLSPPCQPWSLGGVGMGFQTDNGMSFGHAIFAIRAVRPILAVFECADTITGHPHYKLIRHGLSFAGYKQIWTTISHYQDLSAMHRSRWLSVWARSDVQAVDFPGDFKLSVPGKMPWNHTLYCFYLPEVLKQQLIFDDHLKGIYGNLKYLPKSKKSGLSVDASIGQVLHARVLPDQANMPTLCASYSQQHFLSETHLLTKGIYAPLIQKGTDFLFIDPLRFLSLLGQPGDQSMFCANDIEVLFRHLGISTPQAILSVLIALTSVGLTRLPIIKTTIECWKARVTKEHVVILTTEDFLIVTPKMKTKFFFHHCSLAQSKGDITILFDGISSPFFVHADVTVELFLRMCGFENSKEQGIQCAHKKVAVDPKTLIGALQGFVIDIECLSNWVNPNAQSIVTFHVGMQTTQAWSEDVKENVNALVVNSDFPQGEEVVRVPDTIDSQSSVLHSNCIVFYVPTGERVECFLPHEVSSDDLLQVLQFEFGYKGSGNFQWGECPMQFEGKRIFIVDPNVPFRFDGRLVVILWKGSPISIKCVDTIAIPGNLAFHEGFFAQKATVNGQPIGMFDKCLFNNGDSIDFDHDHTLSPQQTISHAWKNRQAFLSTTAECTATDEFDFALRCICPFSEKVFCAQIVDAEATTVDGSAAILQQALSGVAHIASGEGVLCIIPILISKHWCGIEISCKGNVWKTVLVGVPQSHQDAFSKIVRGAVSFPNATLHSFVAPLVSFPGLCGWVLLKRWFQKVDFLEFFIETFGQTPTTAAIVEPFRKCFLSQGGCNVLKGICAFAIIARSAFFCHLATIDAHCLKDVSTLKFGGADEDENMQNGDSSKAARPPQSDTADPWSKFDPWTKSNQKQCKWEDLKLAKDHPFVSSAGQSLVQVHKQQLNANTGGIAFATRASAADLVKVIPNEPAAILVPASDKPLHPTILASQISGPFEVVVEDANTGTFYKRQTILIQIKPSVKYQLAAPVYNAKLDDIKEIVLEVDSRLSKSHFEKPLDVFRKLIDEQFPAEVFQGVNIYGYRKFTPNGSDQNHVVHQVMCKLPIQKRITAIERSLFGPIATRDFVPKGEKCDDTSVVPKFWPVDKQSRDEALKATSGLEGFAGLVVSKRGLAARCWAKKIGIIRKALLPGDERLCEINTNVIPRFTKDSTGWPLAISPGEVIKATYHAVKIAPVPTRCFRVLGVTCWQLSFQDEPKCNKFVVKFNTELHEILLANPGTQINPRQQKKQDKNEKPSSKSQPSSSSAQIVAANEDVADRVTILEAKFQTFEKRQEKVEAQLQSGFDNIHNQLRQVLNAVSQPRDKTPTGETPPPKFPKTY